MDFYRELIRLTGKDREALLQSPVIVDCLNGQVSVETYVAFLTQAYHHVRHTVPLLMACGARLPDRLDWLRSAIVEYIDEEHGHEQWILNDLAACGADAAAVAASPPALPTELMVSYAYDTVQRRNPVVSSVWFTCRASERAIATRAAEIIRHELGLPGAAFSYLRSHGSVDQKHIGDYERIVNRLDDEQDRLAVLHAARVFFRLYGDIFRELPRAVTKLTNDRVREVA
jgi:pyrroloquinoline quinone (PQQ) biosynthesis protein C